MSVQILTFYIAEEVRVLLVEMLDLCLETDSTQFHNNLPTVAATLGRAGQDANPEMKNIVATFSGKLAITLGKKVGTYLKPVVDSLVTNLQH